jgi:hypothetical protein
MPLFPMAETIGKTIPSFDAHIETHDSQFIPFKTIGKRDE